MLPLSKISEREIKISKIISSFLKNYEEDYVAKTYLYFALNSGYPHFEYLLNDKDLEFTFKHFSTLKEYLIKDFGK